MRQAREEARRGSGGDLVAELEAVRRLLQEYREEALEQYEDSEFVQAGVETAYAAALQAFRHEGPAAARARAEREAVATGKRTAKDLLERRIAAVERQRARRTETRPAAVS